MSVLTVESLWQFSITHYQNAQVQTLLLDAQNKLCANVNLVLACLYLDKHHLVMTPEQLLLLHQEVSNFSQHFTQALRTLRTEFKDKQKTLIDYSKIRQNLLDTELILERQEQYILITLISEFTFITGMSENNLEQYQVILEQQNPLKIKSTQKLSDLNQYIS